MFTLNILRLALKYYCIALRNKATPGEGEVAEHFGGSHGFQEEWRGSGRSVVANRV